MGLVLLRFLFIIVFLSLVFVVFFCFNTFTIDFSEIVPFSKTVFWFTIAFLFERFFLRCHCSDDLSGFAPCLLLFSFFCFFIFLHFLFLFVSDLLSFFFHL